MVMLTNKKKKRRLTRLVSGNFGSTRTFLTLALGGVLVTPLVPGLVDTLAAAEITELNRKQEWVASDWITDTLATTATFSGNDTMPSWDVVVSDNPKLTHDATRGTLLTISSSATGELVNSGYYYKNHDVSLTFHNTLLFDAIKITGSTQQSSIGLRASNATLVFTGDAKVNSIDIGDPTTLGNGILRIQGADTGHTTFTSSDTHVLSKGVLSFKSTMNSNDAVMKAIHVGNVRLQGGSIHAESMEGNELKGHILVKGVDIVMGVFAQPLTSSITSLNPGAALDVYGEIRMQGPARLLIDSRAKVNLGVPEPGTDYTSVIRGNGALHTLVDVSGSLSARGKDSELVLSGVTLHLDSNSALSASVLSVHNSRVNLSRDLIISSTGLMNVPSLVLGGEKTIASEHLVKDFSGPGTVALLDNRTLKVHDAADAKNAMLTSKGAEGNNIYGHLSLDKGTLNLPEGKLTVYSSLANWNDALPDTLGNVTITERTVLQGHKEESDNSDFLRHYSQLVTGTLTVKHSSGADTPVTFGANVDHVAEGTEFNMTVDRLDLQSSKTTLRSAQSMNINGSLPATTQLIITGGSDENKDFLSSSAMPREFIISGISPEWDANDDMVSHGSYSFLTLDSGPTGRGGTSKHAITVDAPPSTLALMVSQGSWTVGKLNANAGRVQIGSGNGYDEENESMYTNAVLHISENNGLTLGAGTELEILPGSTLDLTQVGPLVVGTDNFKGVISLNGEDSYSDWKGKAATLQTSDLTASADMLGCGGMRMLSEFDPASDPKLCGIMLSTANDHLKVQGKLTLTPGTGGGSAPEIDAIATISAHTMAALDKDGDPTGLIVSSQDTYGAGSLTLNISGAGKNASFLDATYLAFDSTGTLNLQAYDATNGGGTFDGPLEQTDGTINVQEGHWTLGRLVQGAIAAVEPDAYGNGGSDGTHGGFTHIRGGSLTLGGLTNIEYGTGTEEDNGKSRDYSFGVLVDGSGVLKGDNAVFVAKSGSTYVAADGVEKILVHGSGVLELNWDGKTLTSAERKAIKDLLLLADSTGLIKHEGAKNEDADPIIKDDVALNGSYDADVAQGSGELLTGITVGAKGATEGTNTKVSTGGFGADSLWIKDSDSAKSASVIVSGKNLTLTGATGKGLVEVRNADGSVNVEASQNVSIDAGASVLNIGSAADTAGSGALKGVAVAGGSFNVSNGTFQIDNIDMASGTAGSMTVDARANLATDEIKLTSGSAVGNSLAVQGNSTLTAKKLVASANDKITVGNADAAGSLSVENAEFGGATIVTDPAWKDGQAIIDASKMSVGGSTVTGKFVVGQNSYVTMGNTDLAWLPNVVTDANVKWGAGHITAALGIYRPQSLQANNGGIKVDGSLNSKTTPSVNANEAVFTNQSLLVVNAQGIGDKAALTAVNGTGGLLSVAAEAQLLLVNGQRGSTYTIVSGFTNAATAIVNGGWEKGNLLAASRLQGLTLDKSTAGTVKVTVGTMAASDALPGISGGLGNFLDGFEWAGLNDMDSSNAGIAFISRLTSNLNGLSDREVLSVLESSTQIALTGGAPSASFDAVAVATRAMGERTGMDMPNSSSGYSSGDSAYSFGVWGMPLFRSSEIRSQKSGSFKYSVDNKRYGGIIGIDVTNSMLSGDFRVGAALNVGTGDTKSRGALSKTKNEYDDWGASVYAGYLQENFGLSADLGYNSTNSRIKQDIPVTLGMGGQINSKVDAKSYTVGLKAEYLFQTSAVDITPYVGMRYIAYRQAGYNVISQPGTVFSMGKASMDTFTFPIGVTFSRKLEPSKGWNMTPEVNLAIVPALGDTKLTSKARIPGVNLSPATMTGHVFDGVTGEVGFGLRMAKENMSLGLNYEFQGGSHQRAHSLSAQLRYTF